VKKEEVQIRLFIVIWDDAHVKENDLGEARIITESWEIFKEVIEGREEPILIDSQVVTIALPEF
jgi:hypothetical protein